MAVRGSQPGKNKPENSSSSDSVYAVTPSSLLPGPGKATTAATEVYAASPAGLAVPNRGSSVYHATPSAAQLAQTSGNDRTQYFATPSSLVRK